MFRNAVLGTALVLTLATAVSAENWADKLFEQKTYKFGVVARNAKTEFLFKMKNPYAVDVHITGVRASCGCTTPKIVKQTLTTYEEGGILAVYNTHSFLGKRGATLTVTFDKPRFAEVQLRVDGDIRGDIVTEPSGFDFGKVDSGQPAEQKVRLTYRGSRPNWSITKVASANPHLQVKAKEVSRVGRQVTYEVVATLSAEAEVGYLSESLTLATNDPIVKNLPVMVSGRVVPPVTVSPASLLLGVVRPGEKVTRKLVIIGRQPFKLVKIDGGDGFEFTLTDTAKKVHIVPVTFTAGDKPGKIVRELSVLTDMNQVQAQCKASAAIMEAVAKKD